MTLKYILDSERSEEASGFKMVFIFFPVYKMFTRRSALIFTYSTQSFRKLDQGGTLERSFFSIVI